MQSFLKQSKADQKIAFEQAAAKLRLPPAAVEKDFWVSWTLKQLFTLPCLPRAGRSILRTFAQSYLIAITLTFMPTGVKRR
jgi:hypothetical protein